MAKETVPLTRQGYDTLKEELQKLKSQERPRIIQEIADARAHGDLSENAEYHAAREKQGLIEARINELEDKLTRANIIDFSGQDVDQVKFGAFVTIEDEESGEVKTYRIVGDLESNIADNKISLSSPIAKALLGKRVDETVSVNAPKGVKEFVITEIRY